MMGNIMNGQEHWVVDIKKELLSLINMYEAYCNLDTIHESDMPNWSIVQQAIVNTDSPGKLLEISEELMQINNRLFELSKPVYCA